jgi:hypothetical protein
LVSTLAFDIYLYIRFIKPKKEFAELICVSFKFTAFLFALLSLAACAGLPVRGSVDGQIIETRVDSEVARYYLANYLAGKRDDASLDERIDRVYRSANGQLPDQNELKQLSDDFSVDFAALYLADQIARVPVNARFRKAFDRAYDYTRKAIADDRVRLPASAGNYEVLFVPTYLYKRVVVTGADLAGPRAALQKVGFRCYFVETSDDGPIEANADVVVAAIRRRAESGRRLIIVSASKSGPEVALALTKLGPAGTRNVAAWINAVGALKGTPLVDEQLLPELEFIVGKVDVAGMESLTTARSRRRFNSFHIPDHVFVVNYFGIPFTGSVSFRAGRGYFPLRKFGPNDGMVLLSDMIFPRGVTIAELGSDHFMLDRHLDITTVALVTTTIRWVESPDGQISDVPGS